VTFVADIEILRSKMKVV